MTNQKTALITGITGQDGMGTTQYSAPAPVGAAPALRMNAAPASVGVAPPRRRLFESGQNPMHSQRGRSSNRGHHCKAVNYREDFVIATGKQYTVRQFIEKTASNAHKAQSPVGAAPPPRRLFTKNRDVKT